MLIVFEMYIQLDIVFTKSRVFFMDFYVTYYVLVLCFTNTSHNGIAYDMPYVVPNIFHI